jgi:Zinc carboxypeptidase
MRLTVKTWRISMLRNWLLPVLLALVCVGGTHTGAQDRPAQFPSQIKREQSPQVLARYPDINIKLQTPALAPGRTTYTTQAELEDFINKLAPQRMATLTLGQTPGGRNMQALMFSREGVKTPAELVALQRPVIWLIGQQHGNEPAGAEAMLAVADALAAGELTSMLDAVSVVIIPRANPDGAAAETRDNLGGHDLNRDHVFLSQPETRAIHDLARRVPPSVVVDAHEFTIGRRWVEQFGGLQAVDLMLLTATHPMIPDALRLDLAKRFHGAIESRTADFGLTSFVYHTMSSRAGDRTISIGGNAPGIARNAFGLLGAVSILLESRGVGVGLETYQRRVATQYVAIRAVLAEAAKQGPELIKGLKDLRAAETMAALDLVIAHTSPKVSATLPLIDPVTGQDKSATVSMLDTRIVVAKETRTRPYAYLVPAGRAGAIVARLERLGARSCVLTRDYVLPLERYEVVSRADADARAINPERSLVVRVTADRGTAAKGDVVVPLNQPAGTRIALALEPDAPGGWTGVDLINEGQTTLALSRIPRREFVTGAYALDLDELTDACR